MTVPQDVETLLRETLGEQAAAVRSQINTSQQLRVLTARFPAERRQSRARGGAVAIAAVAAAAAAAVALVQLSPTSHQQKRELPAGRIVLPNPAPVVGGTRLPDAQIGWVDVNFTAPAPDLVLGSVLWVDDKHDGTITRVDTHNYEVLGTRHYSPGEQLAAVGSMTRTAGIVMLPVDDTAAHQGAAILRFDAATGRELAPIRVQHAGAIVATTAGVVAQVGDGRVGIVNAAAGTIMRTFTMPVDRQLAYADGLVWGWNDATSTLVGVDPATGVEARSMSLPGFSDFVMQSDGVALVLSESQGLARVDTRTGTVTATSAESPLNLSRDGAGRLWGIVDGTRLEAFNPTSLRVVRTYWVQGLDLVHVSGNLLIVTDRDTGNVVVYALDRITGG